MNQPGGPPSEETVHTLLEEIVPGATLSAIRSTEGNHHNLVHVIEAYSPTGALMRMILKRYINAKHLAQKARLEFQTLAWLQSHGVAVPKPLYLDETGARFGSPAIVTSFLPGGLIWRPTDHPVNPLVWAREMATT